MGIVWKFHYFNGVYFIISFKIDLCYEGKIKMIEMILGSISVSIGFFGTIFTFIFGLKIITSSRRLWEKKIVDYSLSFLIVL